MTEGLKPYPSYKDSGVEWLRKVPEHWEILNFRNFAKSNKGRIPKSIQVTKEDRKAKLAYLNMEYLRSNNNNPTGLMYPDEDSILAQLGDIILLWDGANAGEFFKAKNGIVSSTTALIRTKSVDKRFFFYSCKFNESILKAYTNGMGIPHVDNNILKNTKYVIPPITEQTAIVRYLNYIDRRIKKYINAKEELIKLLEEQKQAIIHQAVTGQIDVRTGKPYPRYQDSGVEWLKKVPEGWEARRGKFFFREIDIRSTKGDEELLSVSHLTGVTPRSQKNINMFKAESYIGYKICSPGDIAVNTMWAWMAAIGVSEYRGIISSSYHTYHPLRTDYYKRKYLDFLLRLPIYKALYYLFSSGITSSRLRLYPDDFLNIIFIMPSMKEQKGIVDYLNKKLGNISTYTNKIKSQISIMKEYRTRLIADVVTGKVDVREIAEGLPEEQNEMEDSIEKNNDKENMMYEEVMDSEGIE